MSSSNNTNSCPALVRSAKDGQWHLKAKHELDATKLSPRSTGGQLRDVPHSRPPYLGPDPHRPILENNNNNNNSGKVSSSPKANRSQRSQNNNKSPTTIITPYNSKRDVVQGDVVTVSLGREESMLSDGSSSRGRRRSTKSSNLSRLESMVSVATVANDVGSPNFGRRVLPKSVAAERAEQEKTRLILKNNKKASKSSSSKSSPSRRKNVVANNTEEDDVLSMTSSSSRSSNEEYYSGSRKRKSGNKRGGRNQNNNNNSISPSSKSRSDLERDSLAPGIPLDSKSTKKSIDQFEDRLLRMDLRSTDEMEGISRNDTPIGFISPQNAAANHNALMMNNSHLQNFMPGNANAHNGRNSSITSLHSNGSNNNNKNGGGGSMMGSPQPSVSLLGIPHVSGTNQSSSLARRATFFENIEKAKNRGSDKQPTPRAKPLSLNGPASLPQFHASSLSLLDIPKSQQIEDGESNNNTISSPLLVTNTTGSLTFASYSQNLTSAMAALSPKDKEILASAAAASPAQHHQQGEKDSAPMKRRDTLSSATDQNIQNSSNNKKQQQPPTLFNSGTPSSHTHLLNQLHEYNNTTNNGSPRPWETMSPEQRRQNPFFGILAGLAPYKLRPVFMQVEREFPNVRSKGLHSKAFARFLSLLSPKSGAIISETLVQKSMSYFECTFYIENESSPNASIIDGQQQESSSSSSYAPIVKRSVSFPQVLIRYAADFCPRFTDSAVVAVFARIAEIPSVEKLRPNSAILLSELKSNGIRKWATKNLTSNSAPRHRWLAVCDALDDKEEVRKEMDTLIRDVVPLPPDLHRSDLEKRIFGDRLPNGAPLPPPPVLTLDQWRYVVYGSEKLLPLVIALRNDVQHPDDIMNSKQFDLAGAY